MDEEKLVCDFLDQKNIEYSIIYHKALNTIEDCEGLANLPQNAVHYKNLFLSNRQKTEFFLLVMRGRKRFVTKDISKQIGKPRLDFADNKNLMKKLGLAPGSLSPFALLKNKEKDVSLLIDQDFLADEIFAFHPNHNKASVTLSKENFFKFLLAISVEPRYVMI